MTAITVSARVGTEEDAPSAEVTYDFGDSLDEAVSLFGADVVYARFKSAATVDLQALIRRHLDSDKPKTVEEIQALAADWKPGVATRKRKSTKEKVEELFSQLNEADKAAMLEALMNSTD